MAVDHDRSLPDIERTERPQHLPPLGDIGVGVFVRGGAGQATRGHQQVRGDVLDADHPEPILFEDAADAGQQVIVAAAERFQHARHGANRFPVETDLGQSGPHQRADKHQVAAVFSAQQFCKPAELAD